ncbi:MAG: hypothetical protein U9R27_09175 [Campylobacterota bacterium]|nr:hypothetical protein [Campylobacterota bacterium]
MRILLKSFLIMITTLFFVGCTDVNTLCANEDDNTSQDTNSTSPDDNRSDNDDNGSLIPIDPIYPDDSNQTDPDDNKTDENITYTLHEDIKTTLFWVGESDHNSSAWDERWIENFGGVDNPDERDGYNPEAFTPDENPFYAALPFDDLDRDREAKEDRVDYIPWATEDDSQYESICKNRWIKITSNRKNVYAQWEDVGPSDDDKEYVFGDHKPIESGDIGLFVSPAVRDYLGIDINDTVDWEFVDNNSVPDGPWKDIVTISSSD